MYLIPLCIASSVANTGYTTHTYMVLVYVPIDSSGYKYHVMTFAN